MSFQDNGNPFLTDGSFYGASGSGFMTRTGTYIRIFLLFGLLLSVGICTAKIFLSVYQDAGVDITQIERIADPENDKRKIIVYRVDGPDGEFKLTGETEFSYMPVPDVSNGYLKAIVLGGMLVGFLLAMLIIFKPRYAPLLAPVYVIAEGICLGGLSAWLEMVRPGIAVNALVATICVFVLMYVGFALRVFRASPESTKLVVYAMGGIVSLYIVDILLPDGLDIVRGYGLGAIVLSVVVCGLAAWNFVIDFETIERGVENRAPKYMEAYAAVVVMITFVWLYLEIARLFLIMDDD